MIIKSLAEDTSGPFRVRRFTKKIGDGCSVACILFIVYSTSSKYIHMYVDYTQGIGGLNRGRRCVGRHQTALWRRWRCARIRSKKAWLTSDWEYNGDVVVLPNILTKCLRTIAHNIIKNNCVILST